MKNLIKSNLMAYLLMVGLLATQISCSSGRKEDKYDGETVYTDFKNYVTEAENSAKNRNVSDTSYYTRSSADMKADYDAKVALVDRYSADYDENRRAEIEQLKTRYNTYWKDYDSNYHAWKNLSGTNMSGGLAANYDAEEAKMMEPANIRAAYENFTEYVRVNREKFSEAEWKAAENYFQELDNRKNAVQSQLSDKDKYEIGKAKAKYTALRAGRLGIDASEAATTVSDDAQSVGSDIKDATKTGAKKVGNAAETGAEKVGNTAEKVGSQVKSTVKSGAQKIDRKIDDNPNKD